MSAGSREFIVRPDAIAALDRHRPDDHRRPRAEPRSVEAQPEPVRRGSAEPSPHTELVANGRHGMGPLGLLSEKEFQHLVTAQFEYPAVRQWRGARPKELVAAFNPYSAKGRALRYLAARIMLEAYSEEGLCFSVAGAHRGAGATYVVANLGVVFSELGLRTLIVDGNLRRARLQRIFDRPQGGGLASIISGDDSHPLCISSLGEFRDLALLPAGRGAARVSDRIGNGVLRDMLVGLRQAYDVVICDSPAPGMDGDDGCEVIAGMCGNTVTVFRKDRTSVSAARGLLNTLDAVGTKQIGSVLCVH